MAEKLITSSTEWLELKDNGQHGDLLVRLNVPDDEVIIIDKAVFKGVEVCANTQTVIRLNEDCSMPVICKGKSKNLIYGSSTVTLTNRASGYAFEQAKLTLNQESVGHFYDESNAEVFDRATAYIGEYANGFVEGEGTIINIGTTGEISGIGPEEREPNIVQAKKKQIRQYNNDRISFEGGKINWLSSVWQFISNIRIKNMFGR